MSFFPCNIPKCIYQSLVLDALCRRCRHPFCFHHYEAHDCPGYSGSDGCKSRFEPEASQVMALLKPEIIKAEVESLRPGHTVSKIDIPEKWKHFALNFLGSCNFHIKIDFTDGESWIMRIRQRGARRYTDEPLQLNMASEVATNKALYKAGVAVPDAFLRPSNSKHHDKLVYCYQTFISGAMWPGANSSNTEHLFSDPASRNHLYSIVQWFLSMEKAEFDRVGSPCFGNEGNDNIVGPLIERRPVYTVPPYYQGPFKNAKERWLATIDNRISLIISRNYCGPERELLFYLVYMETRALVEGCQEMENPGPFYIKHDDDRYDHIRAKEDGEVTCVLDWEWAYTTNKEEAFAAPTGFVPPAYNDGKNDVLSIRELTMIDAYNAQDRPDLADYVRNGRKYHRLINLLRHNHPNIVSINATERAFLNLPDDHPGQPGSIEQWLEVMKEKYKDDEGLRLLLAKP